MKTWPVRSVNYLRREIKTVQQYLPVRKLLLNIMLQFSGLLLEGPIVLKYKGAILKYKNLNKEKQIPCSVNYGETVKGGKCENPIPAHRKSPTVCSYKY